MKGGVQRFAAIIQSAMTPELSAHAAFSPSIKREGCITRELLCKCGATAARFAPVESIFAVMGGIQHENGNDCNVCLCGGIRDHMVRTNQLRPTIGFQLDSRY